MQISLVYLELVSSIRSRADEAFALVVITLISVASLVGIVIVVKAWLDARHMRIVVERIVNGTGDASYDARCALIGHQLQTQLAEEVTRVSDQLRRYALEGSGATTEGHIGMRLGRIASAREWAARHLHLGEVDPGGKRADSEFTSHAWKQAASALPSRLAVPEDLSQDNVTLVQSLAPENIRPAVALLSSRLVRPAGVRVACTVLRDVSKREGLAITFSDLRGRLAHRRILMWDMDNDSLGMVVVVARWIAIESVRNDLLRHSPRVKWMTERRRGSRPPYYDAVTQFLCGRLFADSARRYPSYTRCLYERALEEYQAAVKGRKHRADVDPTLWYYSGMAEGELGRREEDGRSAGWYDRAIQHCEQAIRDASRGAKEAPSSWGVARTTLLILRAGAGVSPPELEGNAHIAVEAARTYVPTALTYLLEGAARQYEGCGQWQDGASGPMRSREGEQWTCRELEQAKELAYEGACLFARSADSKEFSDHSDAARACFAIGIVSVLYGRVPLSAWNDSDLDLLRNRGWIAYLDSKVMAELTRKSDSEKIKREPEYLENLVWQHLSVFQREMASGGRQEARAVRS